MVGEDKADEKDWFFIFWLSKLGLFEGLSLTTQEIADQISSTQQTVSRRINRLKELNLVDLKSQGKRNLLKITSKGLAELKVVYNDLRLVLNHNHIERCYYGVVQTGMGEGKYYVSIPNYFDAFSKYLGDNPYPGTLNLILDSNYLEEYYAEIKYQKPKIIEGFSMKDRTFGPVNCYDVEVCSEDDQDDKVKCLILDIRRTSHKKGTVEIVSNFNLRKKYNLKDGAKVGIKFLTELFH